MADNDSDLPASGTGPDVAEPPVAEDLVCAFRFDGKGGATPIDWDDLKKKGPPEEGFDWIHIQHPRDPHHHWLQPEYGIDETVRAALLAEETRPRFLYHEDGILLNLRGVNLNPGADPDDMVSIRMFITDKRIVSVRLRRLMAVEDIRQRIEAGKGPRDPGEFVAQLALGLTERMDPVIQDINDKIDALEDEILEEPRLDIRKDLSELRLMSITLRRHISAQKDALNHLIIERLSWIDEHDRSMLREASDRNIRFVEDLDSARERTTILREQLADLRAETMNKNMFVLSIVAAIFLPMGLLTGLLGINVAGIPFANAAWAFFGVCVSLVGIGLLELLIFKRLGWLDWPK